MKKNVIIALFVALVVSLAGCGNNSSEETNKEAATESTVTEGEEEASAQAEEEETAEPEMTTIGVGQCIETDIFKMTVDSIEILDEYSFNTSDNTSITWDAEEGYKLLAVQGVMENNGTDVISDSSFYRKAIVNDSYEVEDFKVNMGFERSTYFEIDPYTEQRYYIYIDIPEKLAEQFETVTFTLGFKNDMSLLTTTYNTDGTMTVDADNWFAIKK